MSNKVLIIIIKTEHKMVTLHTSQVHIHLQTANIHSYTNSTFHCLLLHHAPMPTEPHVITGKAIQANVNP